MKKKGNPGKVIKIVLITLLAVIILLSGGGFAYYLSMVNSPQPQVDGNLQVKGLKDSGGDYPRCQRHTAYLRQKHA